MYMKIKFRVTRKIFRDQNHGASDRMDALSPMARASSGFYDYPWYLKVTGFLSPPFVQTTSTFSTVGEMPPQQRARGVGDDLRSEVANPKEKQNPTANGSTNVKGRRNGNPNGTKASNVLPAELESSLAPQEGQNGVRSRLRHFRLVSKVFANDT